MVACWRRWRATARLLLLSLMIAGALRAQSASGFRVVRRADRRALIVMLPQQLRRAELPVNVKRFVLLDRTNNVVIRLKSLSDTSTSGCPRISAGERLCVALASDAPALDDARAYMLVLDSIDVGVGATPEYVGTDLALTIEPVSARVLAPKGSPATMIEVEYDLDASGDSTLGIALSIDGRELPIPEKGNRRAGQPLCYSNARFSFRCLLGTPVRLRNGETIAARFVRAPGSEGPLPAAKIASDTYSVDNSVSVADKDALPYSISIEGGLSRTTSSHTATLQVEWRNAPFALRNSYHRPSGFGYEGSLSPYLDLLITTDASTKGYVNPGLQYRGLFSWDPRTHFLRSVAAYLTPRAESDESATVLNFIPFDIAVKPGFGGPFTHGLPLGGAISIAPIIGFEKGWTVRGSDVERDESNDPSRWKGGVSLLAKWWAPKTPTGFCKTIGCGGVDISVDWTHYKLNDVPTSATTSNRDYGTFSATYKFTDHAGLSFSLSTGNPPPLFVYQRVESLGLAIVY
jgi:hypothetical protein